MASNDFTWGLLACDNCACAVGLKETCPRVEVDLWLFVIVRLELLEINADFIHVSS